MSDTINTDMNSNVMKLTCSICKKEYALPEQVDDIMLYDMTQHYVVCNDCFESIAKKHYQDVIAAGRNVTTYEGDPLYELKQKAYNDVKNNDILMHLVDIVNKNTPETFKSYLDEYVIGQERAKEIISTAVYNHYKRVIYMDRLKEMKASDQKIPFEVPDELNKANICLVGETGSGKTYLLRTLAKYLDVPFTICDASSLTEAGFVGSDVETCVRQLWQEAGGDLERTQHGIIFLDEFDKIARKSGKNNMITADPSREGVQQALLKMVEGGIVSFNQGTARKNPDAPVIQVDTTNILFIAGGAFDGIQDIIKRRVSSGNTLGFSINKPEDNTNNNDFDESEANECQIYNHYIDLVAPEDFIEFGIIPELLGRLPVICPFHQLDKDDLVKILTEPRNAFIKQYRMLYSVADKANLMFEKEALEAIAEKVIEAKTGARGLRTVLEKHLNDSMFKVPSLRRENQEATIDIRVTKDCIINNTPPKIEVTPVKQAG